MVGLITIVVSSYMILYSERLYEKAQGLGLLKLFRASQKPPAEDEEELKGHIIVIGMNGLGRTLVTELCARQEQVIAVDTDFRKLEDLPGSVKMADINQLK